MQEHVFPVTKSNLALLSLSDPPIWQMYRKSGKTLPPRVSNRDLYGPVLNQENLGSCTAFAATQWRIALRQQDGFPYERLSELAQYYEERVLEGTVNQDSGATMADAIIVLERFGGMPEADDPYDPNYLQTYTQAPPSDWNATLKLRASQALYIANANVNDTKDALARGMAVMASYTCFSEIDSEVVAKSGLLPMPANPDQPIGGHMTNVIGYSDEIGAFLVLNQWGENWGIQNVPSLKGCFWMPYGYFTKYVDDVVAGLPDNGVQPKPNPIPEPFPVPAFDYTNR